MDIRFVESRTILGALSVLVRGFTVGMSIGALAGFLIAQVKTLLWLAKQNRPIKLGTVAEASEWFYLDLIFFGFLGATIVGTLFGLLRLVRHYSHRRAQGCPFAPLA